MRSASHKIDSSFNQQRDDSASANHKFASNYNSWGRGSWVSVVLSSLSFTSSCSTSCALRFDCLLVTIPWRDEEATGDEEKRVVEMKMTCYQHTEAATEESAKLVKITKWRWWKWRGERRGRSRRSRRRSRRSRRRRRGRSVHENDNNVREAFHRSEEKITSRVVSKQSQIRTAECPSVLVIQQAHTSRSWESQSTVSLFVRWCWWGGWGWRRCGWRRKAPALNEVGDR